MKEKQDAQNNNNKKEEQEKKIEVPLKEWEEVSNKAKERDEIWNKYLRVCADIENNRKRWEKEKGEIIKFANYKLLKDLIVIIDELGMAIKSLKDNISNDMYKGLEMVYNNFNKFLSMQGIEKINSLGGLFDPNIHEVVGFREVDNGQEEHIVLEEIQSGYKFYDKVLRPTKVVVSMPKKEKNKNSDEVDKVKVDNKEDNSSLDLDNLVDNNGG